MGWWLAGLTIAVTLAGPGADQRGPAARGGACDRQARAPAGGRNRAVRRIVIEAALVAVAAGGLVVLRNQGLSSGSSGLYTSAAPVLIAIGVAVVVLRCYPPLARELARIAGPVARGGRVRRPGAGHPHPARLRLAVVRAGAGAGHGGVPGHDRRVGDRRPRWPHPGSRWAPTRSSRCSHLPGDSPGAAAQISSMPGVVATATVAVDTGSLRRRGRAVRGVRRPGPVRGRGRPGARPAVPAGRAVGGTPRRRGPRRRHRGRRAARRRGAGRAQSSAAPDHHDPAGRTDRQRPRRGHGRRRGAAA